MKTGSWLTVVELPGYIARSSKILTKDEATEVVNLVASDPECGDLIQGTGGVRKVRIGVEGRGKRGGARVVYYFHSERIPVFLLTIFAKNERSDLSQAERNKLRQLVTQLVRTFGKEHHEQEGI